jgi:hypothetical protein
MGECSWLAGVSRQVFVARVEVKSPLRAVLENFRVLSETALTVPSLRFAEMMSYPPEQLYLLPRVAPAEELGANLPIMSRAVTCANLLFFLAQGPTHIERTLAKATGSPATGLPRGGGLV